MRVGQNPAKFVGKVAQPAKITVAVITYIPFLGGYYAESLEVLKVCLGSIWQNTDLPYDLLLFDNASCAEVRQYLQEVHEQGKIQFLWLSDKNIGKAGAWNILFAGAPGEIIAYADSDVYFYPGWLSALVKVLETFPMAGMVTGMPLSCPELHCESTLQWAKKNPAVSLQEGRLLTWEDYWKHTQSLGKTDHEAHLLYQEHQDILLSYQDLAVYVGAGHFQFVAYKSVLQKTIPLPSRRPMGEVMALDQAIDRLGYLRLSTPQWWVQHLGNSLSSYSHLSFSLNQGEKRHSSQSQRKKTHQIPFLRKILFWVYHKAFELLYRG
ncbi:MAG: glycosyltransferase family A protein [Anaerolineales bacterium]